MVKMEIIAILKSMFLHAEKNLYNMRIWTCSFPKFFKLRIYSCILQEFGLTELR